MSEINGNKEVSNEELARMIAKGFESTASKQDIANLAAKSDITAIRSEMATKSDIEQLRDDIKAVDNKVNTLLETAYNQLEKRVKHLEEKIGIR